MVTASAPTIDEALAAARAHHAAGRVDDAAAAVDAAIRADPTDPDGIAALAHLRLEQARTAEAVHQLGLVAGMTNHPGAWAEWLYYGLHDGTTTPELLREHAAKLRWGEPPPRTYDGRRKLRIAYLSAHHRNHATARFILPLLRGHSDAVEVFGYHDGPVDAVTARAKALCARWRNVRTLNDAQVSQALRADGVDVLIDLDGIMPGGRRQAVIANRPAPVIASYLGYGMDSGSPFVHRITDEVMDPSVPPGMLSFMGDGAGPLIRLPGCCYAYEPRDVPVSPAPVDRNGFVTFGSLNRVCKLSPAVARAWAEILRCVQDARLIVLAPGGEQNASVRRMLEGAGVAGNRLELRPKGDAAAFDAVLAEVDVALDPWPYCGHTTTADCLTSGVPVVTLARPSTSRASASLLAVCGLADWVATSDEAYVRTGVVMARSPFLGATRGEWRKRAMALLDGRRVAKELEGRLMELARA